jgi:hypothetical protein
MPVSDATRKRADDTRRIIDAHNSGDSRVCTLATLKARTGINLQRLSSIIRDEGHTVAKEYPKQPLSRQMVWQARALEAIRSHARKQTQRLLGQSKEADNRSLFFSEEG